MAKVLSEKAQVVLAYVQGHEADEPTAAQIAEALGMEKKSVDGIITALKRETKHRPPLADRKAVEGQKDKVVILYPAGREFDVNAEIPEDAE